MLPIDNYDEIKYYINLAISNNLGYRELANRIKSKEYSRLTLDVREKLCKTEQLKANDLVPNPILIKNKNNIEIISEKILHGLILENIEYFMRQLGNGYSFIGSEYKIKLGDRFNYIDLLLYNIKFKCYVVIELKVTELKKEHTGQVMTYMNYIDKNIKTNDTVGIIICKKNNEYVIDFCSDNRIISREYELV